MELEEYLSRINDGLKWCYKCQNWTDIGMFGIDKHRFDGRNAVCNSCRKSVYKKQHKSVPVEKRKRLGPLPMPPRTGDKVQARQRINVLVRTGRMPHPSEIPCVMCGHVWKIGGRRHEYDHYMGYESEFHYTVRSLCSTCHSRVHSNRTKCIHGHEYTKENTVIERNGTRCCRTCRRERDRNRRDAAWWRDYRKRKQASKTSFESFSF